MAEDQINIDLDPKKVIDSLNEMSEQTKKLATDIENALGKKAVQSVNALEEASEKGTSKITAYFRNLGQRVKEDLKTAFDAARALEGLKFANDIASGAKQVLEMERAFDRLNTRLQLTKKEMADFKNQVGRKVAGTGQKLEDVLPGVETAASKGGVKSPQQLTQIAEALGQAKATTGEDTSQIADTVVEILKSQGQKITSDSFKNTLDALQATRVQGAFKGAGEAGSAIEQLAPYAKRMGLGTRELGGLAATASRSGAAGQDILRQLMEQASQPGGQDKLNAILGRNIFQGGKLQASEIGKVDTGKFGKFSPQVLEQATGLHGAAGADLERFVQAFKGGMDDFNKVVSGSNETASQFATATDNLASQIDKFKEQSKEAGREVAESLSTLSGNLLKGNFKKFGEDLKNVGKSLNENKGTLAAGLGITGAVGVLAGGGLNNILKKLPGGGMAGGLVAGQAAKAAGAQPVYVVNAAEIGSNLGGGAAIAGGALGKVGSFAKGALGVAGAGAAGYAAGGALMEIPAVKELTGSLTDKLYDFLHPEEKDFRQSQNAPASIDPDLIKKAVSEGTHEGTVKAKGSQRTQYTNPSGMPPRGDSR